MRNSSVLAIISILFSFLLFQCGFSFFGPGEHVGDEAGKSGDIKEWVSLANSYYENKDDKQRENGKKILKNLINYRWDDMTTREKFEVAILHSTITFNTGKTSSVVSFTQGLSVLVKSFSGSELTFNDTLNMNFVEQNLPKANSLNQEVQPVLTRLISYSNDINVGEQTAVYLHIGSALIISYADASVNLLGSLTNRLVPLKTAYTNLAKKVEEVKKNATTLPVTQAQYTASTNELCNRELPAVESEENQFGTKLASWNAFLENTMIPDINIINAFRVGKASFLANTSDKIEKFRENFEDFSKGKEKTKEVKAGCKAGKFSF